MCDFFSAYAADKSPSLLLLRLPSYICYDDIFVLLFNLAHLSLEMAQIEIGGRYLYENRYGESNISGALFMQIPTRGHFHKEIWLYKFFYERE